MLKPRGFGILYIDERKPIPAIFLSCKSNEKKMILSMLIVFTSITFKQINIRISLTKYFELVHKFVKILS